MKTTLVIFFISLYFCANLNAQTFTPTHKVLIEDHTICSTGFGIWCPRGIVFVDSFAQSSFNDKAEIISIHANYAATKTTNDPMFDSLYFIGATTNGHLNVTAWPLIVLDRKLSFTPDSIFDYYPVHAADDGVADISVTPMFTVKNGEFGELNVTASVHFASNASHYNLALVLTEDSVHGTTDDYTERNTYANGAHGPMQIGDLDFATLPDPVPAELMYYRHVARIIFPSFSGQNGSLPLNLKADSTYSYTFGTLTLDKKYYNTAKTRAIVLLINNQTGQIANANGANIPNGTDAVSTIQPGAASLTVFPNPFTEKTSVNFTLASSSHVRLEVTNILAESISKEDLGFMEAGEHTFALNKGNMVAGMYLVTINTDEGRFMQKVFLSK